MCCLPGPPGPLLQTGLASHLSPSCVVVISDAGLAFVFAKEFHVDPSLDRSELSSPFSPRIPGGLAP